MSGRRSTLFITISILVAGCSAAPVVVDRPPTVPFADLVRLSNEVTLVGSDQDRMVSPVGAVTTSDHIVLLDYGRADMRMFRRADGTLVRVLSAAGDAPGQLRKPADLARLDSGQFVVLDAGRRVLAFHDSLGALLREVSLPDGAYNSLLALPEQRRVVLAGHVFGTSDEAKRSDLHEFGYDGRLIASYGARANPRSVWENTFTTVYAAPAGREVITATLSSNTIRYIDRQTRTERSSRVAAGWFAPLEWPSDRMLQRGATQQGAAQLVKKWTRQHRLMNGVFALSGHRILSRFQAFSPSGDRFFYYALTDGDGRTVAVTQPTRANVLATNGDTLLWISAAAKHAAVFGTGVVGPVLHGRPQMASNDR
jgi:hypothetical protein